MLAADDGVHLRTWTTGEPSSLPPVILLHGGPGLWDYLEPVARMLEPMTLVHRFDQRGCGGSDPSDRHTVARYIADIEMLRRRWQHDAWIVIGHSFGATLALAYAFAHPERTIAMGYMNGVGVGDNRLLVAETDQRSAAEVLAQAQQLAMPCWFVHGQQDPRPSQPVAALAAVIPRSQMHIIEAAGHQPWHEQPDKLQELLSDLITSTTQQT